MSRMKDIYTELEEDEPDMVNHPPHYTSHPKGFECIDVIEDNPFPNLASAMKYLWRVSWGGKFDDLEDLEKAVWYVQREITRRRNMQAPEPATPPTPLFPDWAQAGLVEMLSEPSPIVQAALVDNWFGLQTELAKYRLPEVTSDEDEEIGVATAGENWFAVPLPGFGLGPAAPASDPDELLLQGVENESLYEDEALRLAVEAKLSDSRRCINCGQRVFYLEGDYGVLAGHIYSPRGFEEMNISSLCEYCFDRITQEVELGEAEPWAEDEGPNE